MRKPKVGDWRIMQSADGSQFWIERYSYFPGAPFAKEWRPCIRKPEDVHATLEGAERALGLMIRGPSVRLTLDATGHPL